MEFDTLHKHIPYAVKGKEKSLAMYPFLGIKLMMPGRHSEDTVPKGGDFVVCVTDVDLGWNEHQFTHGDLFTIIENMDKAESNLFMQRYYDVVVDNKPSEGGSVLLHAVLCLAVAEHRRYSRYESKGGGRYLPLRFSAGIAEGLWTASDGDKLQKVGRPAVEMLERLNGTPVLTKRLLEKIK